MELLNQTEQHIKKVSYTVKHNDKEYILIDFFEGADMVDTIIRDKDGNTVEDAILMEEITTFLDSGTV